MPYCQYSQYEQYQTLKYYQSVLAVSPVLLTENTLLSICAAMVRCSYLYTLVLRVLAV